MLRCLKQKQKKSGRAPTKYIKQNVLLRVRYQNVAKLCPAIARCIGSSYFFGCHLRIRICVEPGQGQWIHKALFSYFSKKMFAVGTH